MKRVFELMYMILIFLIAAFINFGCTQKVVGPAGPIGPRGPAGTNGSNAVPCSVAENSTNTGVVITCPDGTNETVLNGTNGVNGMNGTPVSVVQFCPGYTPSYPSTFPEYGMCLNNQIYAVYWDNKNAWLTVVTPGKYDSTSTSAPCTFTVTDNCGIESR